MGTITLARSSYERSEGNLPPFRVENMFAEESPTEEGGVILQSRRGLADRSASMGAGPVRALFRRDLVLSTALFGVSGAALYNGTTSLGTITGSGFVSMAGNEIGLMIAAGASLHYWNGTTLAVVAFPDSANVVHVFTGGSRFWTIRADTGKLYWTDSLEADIEALDFATAESFPDRLLQGLWIDGMAMLFGKESIEFWAQTGNSDLPIKPLQNMVIEEGLKATGCAAAIGETFAAVTSKNRIIYGAQGQVISNAGLEAKIETSASWSLFSFLDGGTEFLALRLDGETQAWNPRTNTWAEWGTFGRANWAAQCWADGVFGSAVDGKTLAWADGYSDALATVGILRRQFNAGFAQNSGGLVINNVGLRVNVGQTPYLTGDYAEPAIEMRVSRNAGQTWGNPRAASLGTQGDYRQMVQWRGLGQSTSPGFLAEFTLTAPVPLRVSSCFINEQWGGR